jgi:hypothetical protein
MTDEDIDYRLAIHEAGHALAALLLGIENVGAVVFAGVGGLATTKPETEKMPVASDFTREKLDPAYSRDEWPELIRDATFTAAGQVAVDLLLHPERIETSIVGGDGAMLAAAARAACRPLSCPRAEIAFSELAAARARVLLKPVLHRLKGVAGELHRRRMMTAEEIARAAYPEAIKPPAHA